MSRDPAPEPTLDPDRLANKSFGTSFRGYDQDEVRVYLLALSEQLKEMRAYQADLQRRLENTQSKLLDQPNLDEAQLTRLLGEETARVLSAAREAAADIRSRAEENVARLVLEAGERAQETRAAADEYAARVRGEAERGVQDRWDEVEAHGIEIRAKADAYAEEVRSGIDATVERITADAQAQAAEALALAQAELERITGEANEFSEQVRREAQEHAERVRSEADQYSEQVRSAAEQAAEEARSAAERLLAERTIEAEAAADEIRSSVQADTERMLSEAEETLTSARAQADADRQAGQNEGREMVAEAVRVRERMLKDLARRRKIARQQLEQLRAARERLLESYEVVRRTVDEVTQELMVALPEARVAAEEAGRRVAWEPETTVEQLESEITLARQSGLALVPPADADDTTSEGSVTATDTGETEAVAAHLGLSVPDPTPAGSPVSELARPRHGEHVLEVRATVEPGAQAGGPSEEGTSDEGTAEPAAARGVPDELPDADLRDAVVAADGPDPTDEPGPADPPARDVDALFAKLRASRTKASAGARAVLTEERPAEALDLGERPQGSPGAPVPSADEAASLPGTPLEIGVPTAPAAHDAATTSLLERRDAATEKVERVLSRKLKRVLADEQSEVLDAVRRARKMPGMDDVFPSTEAHARRFADAALDDLRQAAEAGADFGGGPGATATAVDDVAEALGREFSSLVRPRIERCFEDLGGDEDELNDRIRAIYREWKTPRLAETARHFVLLAFSRGLYDVMPGGTCLQWVIDDGGQPCPDAEDNSLAGAVERGVPFPTGHQYPPAHPGCRCLVVPAPR